MKPLDSKELDAAALHWPEFRLDGQVFRDYVVARTPPRPGGVPASAEVLRTPQQIASLYLCCACVPRLTRYSGRGDLAAWLKVVATRAALIGNGGFKRFTGSDNRLVVPVSG